MGKRQRKFIRGAIKREGALTRTVGGKPSQRLAKVRYVAKHGTPLQRKQANFYLHVLRKTRHHAR